MLRTLLRQVFAPRRREAAQRPAHGVRIQAEGRLAEAEASFRSVLAQEPGHADAQHLLGHVLLQQKRFDEAAAELRRLLAAAPDNAAAWFTLGQALRALGRLAES